ncbi:hypothetical protein AVEN_138681-1 [Araneus ventricosus]|uniref:Uncharacterized protein n=1 Tax=Araneus ventricosus TaxID=182803 RepID=A0A4Y2RWV3_ARAVE|nr:hypothetical protein AVEN_138681-1 [Araneus ventricosus]
MATEEFYSYIQNLDQAHITGIASEGTNYRYLDSLIIHLIRRLDHVYITLSHQVMNREELDMLNSRLSRLSTTNDEYLSFYSQLICFRNHRITLINKLMSTACELDINSFRSSIFRLFGFFVGVISSLNLGIHLGENLIGRSLKILPFLRLPVRCLFVAPSYFGYMCLITSLAEYLCSKYVVRCIINMIEEDKKLFGQVSNSLLKKDALQDIFTELFSQTIDNEIIMNVNEKLTDLTSNEKIFAAILVSNMRRDSLCIRDVRFLYKAYKFSRTEAAENWFNR